MDLVERSTADLEKPREFGVRLAAESLSELAPTSVRRIAPDYRQRAIAPTIVSAIAP
jgi:hypothetical protein